MTDKQSQDHKIEGENVSPSTKLTFEQQKEQGLIPKYTGELPKWATDEKNHDEPFSFSK